MKKIIHKADDRGHGDYGWLTTNYSFSFGDWYESTRMGFGALRVINDDVIAPSNGFGSHSHRDMEIITIVMKGTVTHKDSMGNVGTVPPGDVQTMSAGTGVTHSEYNDSPTESLELFQIWITSRERGIPPEYHQGSFEVGNMKEGRKCLVDPIGQEGLKISQDAYIYYVALTENHSLDYSLKSNRNGVYLFVISGNMTIMGEALSARDAIGITDTDSLTVESSSSGALLIIEVPMS